MKFKDKIEEAYEHSTDFGAVLSSMSKRDLAAFNKVAADAINTLRENVTRRKKDGDSTSPGEILVYMFSIGFATGHNYTVKRGKLWEVK